MRSAKCYNDQQPTTVNDDNLSDSAVNTSRVLLFINYLQKR